MPRLVVSTLLAGILAALTLTPEASALPFQPVRPPMPVQPVHPIYPSPYPSPHAPVWHPPIPGGTGVDLPLPVWHAPPAPSPSLIDRFASGGMDALGARSRNRLASWVLHEDPSDAPEIATRRRNERRRCVDRRHRR